MIVQFFPRIAGVVVAAPWSQAKGLVNCVARLTRKLTASEAERLEGMLDVQVEGNRLRYSCRPTELEEEEHRIVEALLKIARPLPEKGRGRHRGRKSRPVQ